MGIGMQMIYQPALQELIDQLNRFLDLINDLNSNVKFTLEKDNTINFLNLIIRRTNVNFEFSIYRKSIHAQQF